jgi:heme/copper-type cytochrome/quinol oxidase subunit 3
MRMERGRAVLVVAAILLVSVGGAAVVIWQAKANNIPLTYVLGVMTAVIGIGFSLLNRVVTDEYLRRHFGGEENATRVREVWRGGWVGVLIGALLIAAGYILGASR